MNLVQASGLCAKVADGLAFNNLSFEITEKGVYGFLGKDKAEIGALADILAGVLAPESGDLLYKERSLYASARSNADIRKKLSYASAELYFDADLTAFELIDTWGRAKGVDPDKRYRQIKEALELTGLSAKTEVLFEELTLSEKKRLTIACALVGNPDVIILNDPVHYLDSKQAGEVKKLIRKLGSIKTVLLLSNDSALVEELCDNVAIVHGGELLLWERTEELLTSLKEKRLGGLANVLSALTEEKEKNAAADGQSVKE